MGGRSTYTDDQLRSAIAGARSWRGVLRALGLRATSASSMRSVRRHAERLGLDHWHFTGQRRWSDADLAGAINASLSWAEVAQTLGLSGGSSTAALRGHAVRLGLATQHLSRQRSQNPIDVPQQPDLSHLRRAGSLLAASWFMLRGRDVAWPLEPCPYDLLVSGQGTTQRVQVKTTTRQRGGAWLVRISRHTGPGGPATPYAPEDIDSFFIIDGDLTCFWIPLAVVGGLCELSLAAYDGFRVGSARSLIEHLT